MWQSLKSYLLSISVAYVLGSIFATQFTLSNLSDFSFQISLSDRLFATGQDIISLAGSYLPLIALALFVSFVFASFSCCHAKSWFFPKDDLLPRMCLGSC